jgi:PAS domain S-box-containing protein
MKRGERFLVADVSDLPPDSEEKRLFQVLGIRSIAIIPLGKGESLPGLLSLVSLSRRITWPASIVAQFEVLADIFYNALQRKEITRSLIESEQRFRFLADHSPLMVWMSDVHGQYTYVSRGWLELTGCTLESQLGEGWTTRIAPQDKAACLAANNAAVHTRQRFEMEYRILRSDGEHRWIFSIGTPRYGDAGTFLGFIGSGIDITDRKNAENALMDFNRQLLQRQDAERRRIARDLHDDVVQQVALLAMDLAKSKYVSDSSQFRESLDRFKATTTGIAQSVRQISHTLHSAGIDLLPIAASLRGLCNDFAQRSEVNIRFTERGTVPDISEELKLCLYRVTQEALSNVAQHSHALSATVALASVKDHLLLRIKDDGSGFACNQAQPVSLGLTSVRERVHLSGGSLKIKSGSGRGTTILASFPISRKSNSES